MFFLLLQHLTFFHLPHCSTTICFTLLHSLLFLFVLLLLYPPLFLTLPYYSISVSVSSFFIPFLFSLFSFFFIPLYFLLFLIALLRSSSFPSFPHCSPSTSSFIIPSHSIFFSFYFILLHSLLSLIVLLLHPINFIPFLIVLFPFYSPSFLSLSNCPPHTSAPFISSISSLFSFFILLYFLPFLIDL